MVWCSNGDMQNTNFGHPNHTLTGGKTVGDCVHKALNLFLKQTNKFILPNYRFPMVIWESKKKLKPAEYADITQKYIIAALCSFSGIFLKEHKKVVNSFPVGRTSSSTPNCLFCFGEMARHVIICWLLCYSQWLGQGFRKNMIGKLAIRRSGKEVYR